MKHPWLYELLDGSLPLLLLAEAAAGVVVQMSSKRPLKADLALLSPLVPVGMVGLPLFTLEVSAELGRSELTSLRWLNYGSISFCCLGLLCLLFMRVGWMIKLQVGPSIALMATTGFALHHYLEGWKKWIYDPLAAPGNDGTIVRWWETHNAAWSLAGWIIIAQSSLFGASLIARWIQRRRTSATA